MKNIVCIITETITKNEATNDLINTHFDFAYGDAAPVAPHIISDATDTYKVSRTVVGTEARNCLNNILDGYYEFTNYTVVYPN